ncbi:MAG TPA: hypothetical protein VHB77_22110 [Planctomycetaceae bacterium]|nr:hypothetical protein [Planctomycetaceae bacterium]
MDGSPVNPSRSTLIFARCALGTLVFLGGCAGVEVSRTRPLAPKYVGLWGLDESRVAWVTQHRLNELPVGAPCKVEMTPTHRGLIARDFTTVEGEVAEVTDQGLRIKTAKSKSHHKASIVLASVTVSHTQPEQELLWIPRAQILRVTYEAWHWPAKTRDVTPEMSDTGDAT